MVTSGQPSFRLAALLTCHNRKAKTLSCLEALFAAADAAPGLKIEVFVTDDGSTDGTSAAIRTAGYPVELLSADGSKFWTGGTLISWDAAIASATDFDGYLLLNDDTTLDRDALAVLTAVCTANQGNAVVVAAIRDPESAQVSYGGVVRTVDWHPAKVRRLAASPEVQVADTFNANCVLVPKAVFERVGPLDPAFTHGFSDFDYGYRATAAGFQVLVAPGVLGTCARNSTKGTWEDPALGLRRRLELLNSPKGLPWREWAYYLRRHGPWFWPVLTLGPAIRIARTAVFRRAGQPGHSAPRT